MAGPDSESRTCKNISRNIADDSAARKALEGDYPNILRLVDITKKQLDQVKKDKDLIAPFTYLPDFRDVGAAMKVASNKRVTRLLKIGGDVTAKTVRQAAQAQTATLDLDEHKAQRALDEYTKHMRENQEQRRKLTERIEASYREAERSGCDMRNIRYTY